MSSKDVLISGASIAGPALAYWLLQAGFNPTVVERAPRLRTGGQAVDVRGAGRTVVERMGLLEAVKGISLDQQGMAWVDRDGRFTAQMPADAFGGEGFISEIEILRGDLSRLFHEASLPGTEYLFDDTITGIEQHADGVDVTFEHAPARRFALVIGADGLHSTVRRLAFSPPDPITSLGCYIAWFTAPGHFDLNGWYQMYNEPGGLVASARPGRLPGEIKASLAFRADELEYDRRDVDQQRAIVAERLAGMGWHTPRLIEAMRTADDFSFAPMAQVHLDSWSMGRVALVGDAGYCPTPLTGLGTSLALVGAYVLAGELAAANGEHAAAFARYADVIRPYVTTCQQLPPRGASGYAPGSRLGIRLGALSIRLMTRWPVRPMLEKQFAKASGIDLPDYQFLGRQSSTESATSDVTGMTGDRPVAGPQ